MEPTSDRERAADALRAQEAARRDILARTAPPLWATLAVCATFGAFITAALLHAWVWAAIAGAALLAAAVLEWRLRGRHGRVTDEAAVGRGMGAYALWYLPLALLVPLSQGDPGPLWLAVVTGVAYALITLVYLTWTERYQARRLSAGDYRPWDIS